MPLPASALPTLEGADAEAALPVFEWETLPRERWLRKDVVAASVLGHRPRHRVRSMVYEADEKDFAAGEEAARLEAEATSRGLARRRRLWSRWADCRVVLPKLAAVAAGFGVIALAMTRNGLHEPEALPTMTRVEVRDGGVVEEEEEVGLAEKVLLPHLEDVDLHQADSGSLRMSPRNLSQDSADRSARKDVDAATRPPSTVVVGYSS